MSGRVMLGTDGCTAAIWIAGFAIERSGALSPITEKFDCLDSGFEPDAL
jgi:hypothetical protein